jgi:alpha-glucosidase
MHLEQSIPMLLGLGLSGVPFVGADIPGFLGIPTPELLVRWTQLGAFYPLMRYHAAKGTPPKEPWRFGEPWLSHVRRALQLRYRLLPTLYTLLHDASESGLPPLRALPLEVPSERGAVAAFDQLMFGPDLLVCPVVKPGQQRRLAWIPPGAWREVLGVSGAGKCFDGPSHQVLEAPLDRIPLLLRAGGMLALTPSALHTSTADWSELEWLVHAGPEISGQLYEDAGEGYGASRTTRISGGLREGRCWLERRVEGPLPLHRATERIRLLGLPSPVRSISGAERVSSTETEDEIELVAPADWDRIELEL